MGIFGKKNDVIDFSYLQKRGVLREREAREKESNDVVDFRPSVNQGSESSVSSNSSGSSGERNFPDMGFLSGLASASTSGSNEGPTPVPTFNGDSELAMNEMKLRLEDSEYKIELLEGKIRELEKKLEK